MDPTKIAAFASIPLAEVEHYIGNLRENGIWTTDDKVAVESYPDVEPMEIILQVLCATDMIERRAEDQPRYYPSGSDAA